MARADDAALARAGQPAWSSPLVTTSALIEQRLRFDTGFQSAGNGADTTMLDGGRGLDVAIGPTDGLQIALPSYQFRTAAPTAPSAQGFGDWSVLRWKHRIAAAPAGRGNYVLSVWLQAQFPTGIPALSADATTLLPTIGFGKGWGRFDIQGTLGVALPTAHVARIGHAVTGNLAFQYHVGRYLWPQLEVNWTAYPDGRRAGLDQLYLTPGLVLGRFPIDDIAGFTAGVGYQSAVAPRYRASPLTPGYNHAWLITTRLNF